MKRILMVVGGVIGVAVVGFFGLALSQPAHAHVERSATFAASPADVFPYVNDMDRWLKWNPWEAMEPGVKHTFSDNRVGVGAWYTWEGEKTGAGKMTITASTPDQRVEDELAFTAPFESTAAVSFTLTAEGENTKVVWAYDADEGLIGRGMGALMGMDAMLGGDFEKGLTTLKPLVEADATARKQAEKAAADAAAAAQAMAADPAEALGGEATKGP